MPTVAFRTHGKQEAGTRGGRKREAGGKRACGRDELTLCKLSPARRRPDTPTPGRASCALQRRLPLVEAASPQLKTGTRGCQQKYGRFVRWTFHDIGRRGEQRRIRWEGASRVDGDSARRLQNNNTPNSPLCPPSPSLALTVGDRPISPHVGRSCLFADLRTTLAPARHIFP
jgi:hypothetical protein